MKYVNISQLTGKTHEREIDVDPAKVQRWLAGLLPGNIQDVFPELGDDDREFMLTGITPEEWAWTFGVSEEDDGDGLESSAPVADDEPPF